MLNTGVKSKFEPTVLKAETRSKTIAVSEVRGSAIESKKTQTKAISKYKIKAALERQIKSVRELHDA